MRNKLVLMMALLLLFIPGILALGNSFIFKTTDGNVTLNTSIITGTNISCEDVIGSTSDLCTITGGVGGNLTNLSQMTDTNINDATTSEGESLFWNDTLKQWEPRSPVAAGDTNETVRFTNLVNDNCTGTDKMIGVQNNGTVLCGVDQTAAAVNTFQNNVTNNFTVNIIPQTNNTFSIGHTLRRWIGYFSSLIVNELNASSINIGGVAVVPGTHTGNIFDQNLNTTENVSFNNLNLSSLTEGSVLFAGANGLVSENNANFYWNDTTNGFVIGGTEASEIIGGVEKNTALTTHSQGGANAYDLIFHRHSASSGTFLAGARSRGSEASEVIVQDGDNLFDIFGLGFDGTDYETAASIQLDVDGTPGDNDMPGMIRFLTTPDGSTTLVERVRIDSTGFVNVSNIFHANQYQTDQGSFNFNFYDDGSEAFMNISEVTTAFNIESENSKLALFNTPSAGNDFKVFQVFSKEASDVTEFVITKATDEFASYFVRSLAIVGNSTTTPTPHNCSTYANYVDCKTDATGADLYVQDDVEVNGALFVGEGINATNWGNVSITESQINDLSHIGDDGITLQFLNITGNDDNACGDGDFAKNVTFNEGDLQIVCDTPAGGGDITSVQGDDFITNGSNSGAVNLVFNRTLLNESIDARASGLGDNASWNESLATTLFAGIEWGYNETTLANTYTDTQITNINNTGNIQNLLNATGIYSTFNSSYDAHVQDNSSWNESHADTLYASIGSGNASWNESYADGLYIAQGEEANLNTNSSDFWDDMNTINATQMEDNGGTLNILESWFSTLFDTLFGAKDTDDLSQGSTNLYNNNSFNETLTDSLYADISVTGDNASWNESLATTLFAGIEWGYNETTLANTYTDTQITVVNTTTNIENLGFTQGAHIGNCSGTGSCENIVYDSGGNMTGNYNFTDGNITIQINNKISFGLGCIYHNGSAMIHEAVCSI